MFSKPVAKVIVREEHMQQVGTPDAASVAGAARAGMEAEVSGLPRRSRSILEIWEATEPALRDDG